MTTYAYADNEQVEMPDEDTCPFCDHSIKWGNMFIYRGNRAEEGFCKCAAWLREERGDEWAYTAKSRKRSKHAF